MSKVTALAAIANKWVQNTLNQHITLPLYSHHVNSGNGVFTVYFRNNDIVIIQPNFTATYLAAPIVG